MRGDPEVIPKSCDIYPCPVASQKPAFLLIEMVRPGGFELPAFWFVANGIKMLNALFGVAYELETPFFPQLAAPNVAPKTEFRSNFYSTVHKLNPKSQVRLGEMKTRCKICEGAHHHRVKKSAALLSHPIRA